MAGLKFRRSARTVPATPGGASPSTRFLVFLAVLSLAFFAAYRLIPASSKTPPDPDMLRAARLMDDAIRAVRGCAEGRPTGIDPRSDINRTGFIGLESSSITTSPGHLEAKRTSTNPNFAAAVVRMLKEAGVGRGDAVAVGASGSFPALGVATLAAIRSLEAKPVLILSLGASNWGANDPAFTGLEILDCLRRSGVLDVRPAALAVGGENDDGSDMAAEGRALLGARIAASGYPFLRETDLAANVRRRMAFYQEGAGAGPIKAFVNVGGSWANMGTDSRVLELKPGLADSPPAIPAPAKRGVIQEMASRRIPVIHLLFVKGLADRYGLPWDPIPLPGPGEGPLFALSARPSALRTVLAIACVLVIVAALIVIAKSPIAKR
jgi:poly-gamma-glutamate system protein